MGSKILVLGAGVSGLVAADVLVSGGMDVEIVEQGEHVGGRLQSVYVNGMNYDIGATLLTPYFVDFLAKRLGLEIDVVDITWDVIATSQREPMRIDTSKTALEDVERITGEKWYSFLWNAVLFLSHIHDFRTKSIQDFLEEIDINPKLRVFLSSGGVDAGLPTNLASAYTLKLMQYAHDFKYPVGSTSQITQRLAEKVKSSGGKIHLGKKVEEVRQKGSRVEVRTSGGTFTADYVVSCMGVPHTLKVIRNRGRRIRKARKMLSSTYATIQTTHLLYTYSGNPHESYRGRAPLLNYYPLDTVEEINSILENAMKGRTNAKGFYVHFPAMVDETLVVDGKYPVSFWLVTAPEVTDEEIAQLRKFVETEYAHYLPDFAEKSEFIGVQSPRSFLPLYNDAGTTSNLAPKVEFPVFAPQLTERIYMAGSGVEVDLASSVEQASASGYKVASMLLSKL